MLPVFCVIFMLYFPRLLRSSCLLSHHMCFRYAFSHRLTYSTGSPTLYLIVITTFTLIPAPPPFPGAKFFFARKIGNH